MLLEVSGEVLNLGAENRNLYLGRSSIRFMRPELRDDVLFLLFCEHGRADGRVSERFELIRVSKKTAVIYMLKLSVFGVCVKTSYQLTWGRFFQQSVMALSAVHSPRHIRRELAFFKGGPE